MLTIIVALGASCSTDVPGVYRGGELVQSAPLGIEDRYSFRFVEKWRISHRWLSGPTELRGCQGYPSNSFRRIGGYGILGNEINPPFVERNGTLYVVSEHKGVWSLDNRNERIYGLKQRGESQDYLPFCGHGFKDSLDFLALYIIKPDASKGTDEWVSGATPVVVNGLHWLHKTIPIRDWSDSRERLAAPIEYWVLKIPDTEYWLVLRFSATSSYKNGMGSGAFPAKHKRLLDLYYGIVQSVKLEPITPINIDDLVKETR